MTSTIRTGGADLRAESGQARCRLFVLACVLAGLLVPALASASTGRYAETRVRGLDLGNAHFIGAPRPVTLGTHQGYAPAYDAIASGSLLAARATTEVGQGLGRAAKRGTPNSIYEQLDDAGKVRSRTFYDENGHPFSRQDFDRPHGGLQPHEHNRTFDAQGRPITPEATVPLPPGYDNTPTVP